MGPGWFRLGRAVRYDPAEVWRWLNEECEWSEPVEPPGPALVAEWRATERAAERRRAQARGSRLRLVEGGRS